MKLKILSGIIFSIILSTTVPLDAMTKGTKTVRRELKKATERAAKEKGGPLTKEEQLKLNRKVIGNNLKEMIKDVSHAQGGIKRAISMTGVGSTAIIFPLIIGITLTGILVPFIIPIITLVTINIGLSTRMRYHEARDDVKFIEEFEKKNPGGLAKEQKNDLEKIKKFLKSPISNFFKKNFEIKLATSVAADKIIAQNKTLENKINQKDNARKIIEKYLIKKVSADKYQKIINKIQAKIDKIKAKEKELKDKKKKTSVWKKPFYWFKGQLSILNKRYTQIKNLPFGVPAKLQLKSVKKKIDAIEKSYPEIKAASQKELTDLIEEIDQIIKAKKKYKKEQKDMIRDFKV